MVYRPPPPASERVPPPTCHEQKSNAETLLVDVYPTMIRSCAGHIKKFNYAVSLEEGFSLLILAKIFLKSKKKNHNVNIYFSVCFIFLQTYLKFCLIYVLSEINYNYCYQYDNDPSCYTLTDIICMLPCCSVTCFCNVWQLDLQLPMQSVPIITDVVSSNLEKAIGFILLFYNVSRCQILIYDISEQ